MNPFWIFILLLVCVVLAAGVLYTLIWVGWWLNTEVELFSARQRAGEDLIKAKAEHERKLLDLEYQKAKVLSDQIMQASKGD